MTFAFVVFRTLDECSHDSWRKQSVFFAFFGSFSSPTEASLSALSEVGQLANVMDFYVHL